MKFGDHLLHQKNYLLI